MSLCFCQYVIADSLLPSFGFCSLLFPGSAVTQIPESSKIQVTAGYPRSSFQHGVAPASWAVCAVWSNGMLAQLSEASGDP